MKQKRSDAEIEAAGEHRCRHVSLRELLDLGGGYESGITIARSGDGRKEALNCQAADDIDSDPQQGCRLTIVEKAFRWCRKVWRRAMPAEILGPEQVASNPTKPLRTCYRHQTAVNNR